MASRELLRFGRAVALAASAVLFTASCTEAQSRGGWVAPRTADGRPDLQGNWTNATITPIERPEGRGPTLTKAEAADVEGRRKALLESLSRPSDPNRGPPPVGGVFTGDARFDAASGGTGGYNTFFIDAGDVVAVVNGEPRSSLITRPANGRVPPLTARGRERLAELRARRQQFGEYDNPENRPLAERCILSFGSNAGPPMLPNYFYNNNYTIVQTPDHVMIMTEMVHDARIIRMGEGPGLPAHVRPYMGDSRGRWAGDTLVIETTNIHPVQAAGFYGASEKLRVIERFTRADENTLLYSFTIDDPETFAEPWGGELPFRRLDELVYEYACHEGNYALSNVLSGARAQERARSPRPPESR
jgi:hypothetical protein